MEYTEIECTVIHTTGAAVLIKLDGDDEFWVPFSQIEDNGEDLKRGYVGSIYVSQWLAEREGIS